MKKRILSMLMLVVMVVTALPLMALTVFATTEFDADDYNALYVQDGLIWAVDFFDTNANWGGASEKHTSKGAIEEAVASRVWYDASSGTQSPITFNATYGTSTGVSVGNGRLDLYGLNTSDGGFELKNVASHISTAAGSGATFDGMIFSSSGSSELSFNNVILSFASSKLSRVYQQNSDGYIPAATVSGMSALTAPAGVTVVMKAPTGCKGSYGTWNYNTKVTYRVGTYIEVEGEDELVLSVSSTTSSAYNYCFPTGLKTATVEYVDGVKQDTPAEYTDIYIESDHKIATGEFEYYQNGVLAYEKADDQLFYLNNGIGFYEGTYWKKTWRAGVCMYAARYYNDTLTAEEVSQNHLADLAKWYKIDITEVSQLNDASLLALATDPEVKALGFNSDTATVEAVIKPKAATLLAAQPKELTFTADDYNTLYVQDGLIWAFDFFDTNSEWGGAAETLADADAVKNAITSRVWLDATKDTASPITPAVTFGSTSVTLSGGKLLAYNVNTIQMKNVHVHTNSSRGKGATMEQVLTLDTKSQYLVFNNIRVGFVTNTTTNEVNPNGAWQNWLTAIGPQSDTLASVTFNKDRFAKFNATMGTVSMVTRIPATTLDAPWWNHNSSATCAYPPVKYRVGTYMTDAETGEVMKDGDGNPIISVSSTESASTPQFYLPAGLRTVTTEYVDGVKQETAQEYTNVYIRDDHYVSGGEFALYQDGEALYANDNMPWLNNTSAYGDSTYLALTTTVRPSLYATRYYNRTLTAAEAARNSLADLAKWYKIDLTYTVSLSDEMLAKLATDPAVAALDFKSGKDLVETTVKAKAEALFLEQFAGKITDDMQAVIVAYGLDGSPFTAYPAGVLSGTYAYLLDGYKAANGDAAAVRAGYKAAYDADIAALSTSIGDFTAEEYDALYVDRGLQFAMDFFKLNSYWNAPESENYIEYKVPVGAAEETEYWYDANKNGAKDEGEIYDFKTDTSKHNTDAFKEARTKWSDADKAFLLGFRTFAALGTSMSMASSVPDLVFTDGRTAKTFSNYTLGDGYIQLRPDMWGSGYLNVTGAGSLPTSSVNTLQLTAAMGGNLNGQPHLIYHGVRPTGSNGTGFVYTGFSSGFTGFTYAAGSKGFTNSATVPASLTYTILGGDAVGEDTFKVANENGPLVSATGTLAKTVGADVSIYLGWNNSAKNLRVYAVRYYLADLTQEERAQNHFADLAKFFRLNLTGFAMLSDDVKQDIYDATLGFDFTSSREAIQTKVNELILPNVGDAYEAMKGDNAKINDFLDVAADYLFDLGDLLTATRDMSSVYDVITADALTGKSITEAQKYLDEAIFDAWNYLSYTVADTAEQAEAFNAMLVWCAKNCSKDSYVNLEPLMALPYAKRLGALSAPTTSIEEAQAFIDEYVAEKMAEYSVGSDFDYDALYVQKGLQFAVDFFKMNSYWNVPGSSDYVDYAALAPVGAVNQTEYWYDADKDGVKDEDEIYDFKSSTEYHNTDAYKQAYREWLEADKGFLGSFVTYPGDGTGLWLQSYSPCYNYTDTFKNTALTTKAFSVFTVGDGYIQLRTDFHTSGSLSLQGTGSLPVSAANTMQLTAAMGGNMGVQPAVIFHGVRPMGSKNGNNFTYTGIANIQNSTSFKPDGNYTPDAYNRYLNSIKGGKPFTDSATAPVSLTYSILGGDEVGNDTLKIANQKETLASVVGTLGNTTKNDTAILLDWAHSAKNMRIYALRYYLTDLTPEQRAQNHFADLAKWFKLDVSVWGFAPESIRQKAYAAVVEAGYTFDSDPAEIQKTIDDIFAACYDDLIVFTTGEDADEKNAAFRELAAAARMNIGVLSNLGAERREALVGGLVDSFDLNYAFSPEVFAGEYGLLTKQLTAMSFVGYQVRIDTGAPSQNYAGVRAVFDVDTALIEELVRSTGKSVTVSAGIELGDERVATISFVFSLNGDEVTFVGENRIFGATPEEDIVKEATLYERGEGITSFNYVMTYKGDAATAENFAIEYSYVYDILVDGVNNDFSITTNKLGPTVSAYEVYSLFAAMDDYKDDVVVKSVVPAIAE